MSFLKNLLIGNGTLRPKLRAQLEAEGLVLVEEGLGGSVRYSRFRAPGKRFDGKVTGERIGLGISQRRFVVYCRSGRGKLIDSEFSNPLLDKVDVLSEGDRVVFRIDYDRDDEPSVSGEIKISAQTPNAAAIVAELERRIRRR